MAKLSTKVALGKVSKIETVSGKIRKLNTMGFTRSEIATMLVKRYQHVRNVLVEDERLNRK